MLSVTKTGTNLRPLWTANVRPTASGTIVERRDQVLITFFELVALASSIFFAKWPSMNGPFLILRAMVFSLGCLQEVFPERVGEGFRRDVSDQPATSCDSAVP